MATQSATYVDEEEGSGWLLFASTMLGLAGILGAIDGIVALAKSKLYFAGASYVISDVRTWGWISLLVGILLIVAAAGVIARSGFSRWFGIFAAAVSAMAHFTWLQVYPFWSFVIIALDVLVIYALAVYGGKSSSA